ncbi:hypothetical protein COLO4_28197 [Corchorus olitorius]|uniref:Uncharacterized protein n=1 Tax=Corchorus olitorius TaxID=93759 RepID=A0A1R3HM66_9ROSI|nr:hypothetical protein COLO4_28197 [Corchorus olitorius]
MKPGFRVSPPFSVIPFLVDINALLSFVLLLFGLGGGVPVGGVGACTN